MLRPVTGAAADTGYIPIHPHPHSFYKKEFSLPPLAGHMGSWDDGWAKAKAGKHSAHSFSCFDLKCSYSKEHRSQGENKGVGEHGSMIQPR